MSVCMCTCTCTHMCRYMHTKTCVDFRGYFGVSLLFVTGTPGLLLKPFPLESSHPHQKNVSSGETFALCHM